MSFQHRTVITPWIWFRRAICLGYACYRGQEGEASPCCHACLSRCFRHPKPGLIQGLCLWQTNWPSCTLVIFHYSVSCQHFPEEFNSQKRKMWEWECVCARACSALYTCVKACISAKPKWTCLIQVAAFLLIWNLVLNECHRICENSRVIIENFTVFYKRVW